MLLVDPGEDFDRLIVEIRAGTGGDEAALFAGDLYEMYTRYARDPGVEVEEIDFSPGEAGGFKEIVVQREGRRRVSELRYESGGHRVQRVPKTETQGRIHTSAATVAVLPEPDEVQVEINPADLEVESDAGRRGRRAARQQDRERRPHLVQEGHAGRDRSEVPGRAEPAQEQRPGDARAAEPAVRAAAGEAAPGAGRGPQRTLIGSGDRNERIRTYNFPQNRVTDHRINLTLHTLDAVITGEMGGR